MNAYEKAAVAPANPAGIEYDLTKRWEAGTPHHPKSVRLFQRLKEIDWLFVHDYFCWKSGGDGDNGETLMYELDIIFEERDAVAPPQPSEEANTRELREVLNEVLNSEVNVVMLIAGIPKRVTVRELLDEHCREMAVRAIAFAVGPVKHETGGPT